MTDGRALTFAVPDLHGRFDLLDAVLEAIDRYPSISDRRTVVFLGDYVDRGPASAAVLSRLIRGTSDASRWLCLKGNHEEMMRLALRHPAQLDGWIGNGGDATIASYRTDPERLPEHLVWLDALPTTWIDRHRIFVHAGVDGDVALDNQTEETLLWKRYADDDPGGYGDRHVVHGHNPHVRGPRCYMGRTALDTLAWRTGRLVAGVFDDDVAGGPVDLIEIRRPADGELD